MHSQTCCVVQWPISYTQCAELQVREPTPDMCDGKWDRLMRMVSKDNRSGVVPCHRHCEVALALFFRSIQSADQLPDHLISSLTIPHLQGHILNTKALPLGVKRLPGKQVWQ